MITKTISTSFVKRLTSLFGLAMQSLQWKNEVFILCVISLQCIEDIFNNKIVAETKLQTTNKKPNSYKVKF